MENLETERKFLVKKDVWNQVPKPPGTAYMQGYLCIDDRKAIRARVAGNQGFLTIKGAGGTLSRPEFEYPVPAGEASRLIELFAVSSISKTRTRINSDGRTWEVDEFHGENQGLLLAEIELESEGETFVLPEWAGEEVTSDIRYSNAYLSVHPWKSWAEKKP